MEDKWGTSARGTQEQVEYGPREALEHVNRVRGTLDMRARSKRNLADSGQCGLFSNYLIWNIHKLR